MRTRATIAPVILGTALLLALFPALSFAQSSPAKASPSRGDPAAQARARFSEGVAFAKKEQWQAAYVAFSEAWKLKKHPQIALNLGRVEMMIGKHRDAVAHLRYVVDQAEVSDTDRALTRGWLAELERKVGRLAITVDVAGAEVLVNGVSQGASPLAGAVIVDPGKHEIEIRRGAEAERRIIEVTAGATVDVGFAAASGEPAVEPAMLPPPARTIVVSASPPPWRSPVLITGSTLAAGGLVVGGLFLGLSFDKAGAKEQAAKDPNGRDAMARASEDEAMFKSGMVWGFVGAGVALAGTAAVFFLTRPSGGPKVQGAVRFGNQGLSVLIRGEL